MPPLPEFCVDRNLGKIVPAGSAAIGLSALAALEQPDSMIQLPWAAGQDLCCSKQESASLGHADRPT